MSASCSDGNPTHLQLTVGDAHLFSLEHIELLHGLLVETPNPSTVSTYIVHEFDCLSPVVAQNFDHKGNPVTIIDQDIPPMTFHGRGHYTELTANLLRDLYDRLKVQCKLQVN